MPEVGEGGGDVGYGETDALDVAFAGDVGDFAWVRVRGEDVFSVQDFDSEFAGLFGVVGEDGDYSGRMPGSAGWFCISAAETRALPWACTLAMAASKGAR